MAQAEAQLLLLAALLLAAGKQRPNNIAEDIQNAVVAASRYVDEDFELDVEGQR